MLTKQQRIALVPWAFVGIWSTGFIGAKYAVPYMEPFSVLLVRMLLTLLVFAGLLWWRKSVKPRQPCHDVFDRLLRFFGHDLDMHLLVFMEFKE